MASTSARSSAFDALVAQLVVLVLLSLIIDGGVLATMYLFAVAAFWGGVIWMWVRCCGQLQRWQLALIRIGWIPLTVLAMFVIGLMQDVWAKLGIHQR